MSDIDDLVEASTASQYRKPRPKHPTGYEPGFVLDSNREGFLVPKPRPHTDGELIAADREPWDAHLRKAGLDPAKVEVVPPVEVRTWDAAIGGGQVQTMVYFKAKIIARTEQWIDQELASWILKWKPTRTTSTSRSEQQTLVVAWSDTQIGKSDGDGSRGTIERWMSSHGQVQDMWRDLRRQGIRPGRIMVASLGDIVEGCSGHYAQQTFRADQNTRNQRRLARRVMTAGLKTFADLAPVLVMPVGGNHGEVRQAGKSYTDFADNIDVAVVEDIAEIMAENPDRFGNISFALPQADLTQTVDVHGTVIGLAHGHQARGAGNPAQKIERWWQGQMKGRQAIGDADILLTGHFHNFLAQQIGPRMHFQAPALDGGSEWFVDVAGTESPAGTLTMLISGDGWDRLRILPAVRTDHK